MIFCSLLSCNLCTEISDAHSQRLDALEESMNDIRMMLDEIKGRTNTVKQRLEAMNIGGPM